MHGSSVWMYVWMGGCMYVWVYVCVGVRMCGCIYVSMRVRVCMYVNYDDLEYITIKINQPRTKIFRVNT